MSMATSERRSIFVLVLTLGMVSWVAAQTDKFQPQIPGADVQQLERARALRSAKNPNGAIAVLKDLVARQPNYFNAQYELGLAYADRNEDIHRALPPLERAASIKRSQPAIADAHIFNTLGWAYMYAGDSARAEAALKEAESHLDQLTPEVRRRLYNNLGFLYLNLGRRAEAGKYLGIAASKYDSDQARINLKTLDALNQRDTATK